MKRVAGLYIAWLVVAGLLVLVLVAFVGYRMHDNYARSEECLEDVLHLIRELQDLRKENSDQPSEYAYRVQQHVSDARRLLSPWIADSQPDRHRIVEAANGALTEFERAADLCMKLNHDGGSEQLAEFRVKVDSSRERLAEISATIHKHPPPLTSANKRHLIRYIDNVFGTELEALRKSKGDPNAQMEWEAVAVLLIRNDLEGSPKPLNELF